MTRMIKNRLLWVVVATIVLISGIVGIGFSIVSREITNLEKQKEFKHAQVVLGEHLGRIWRDGPTQHDSRRYFSLCGASGCDPNFFRCNPIFLAEYLRQNKVEFGKEFQPVNITYQLRLPSLGYKTPIEGVFYHFAFDIDGKKIELNFLDSCREIALPRRKYLSLRDWDNFESSIFIDRNRVTNSDIAIFNKNFKKEFPFDPGAPAVEASQLTKAQMHEYCFLMGKQPLDVLTFLAAAEFPRDTDINTSEAKSNSSYSFSKHVRKVRPYLLNATVKDKRQVCSDINSKECQLEFPLPPFSTSSSSWIGIYEIHTGEFEYLYNPINSEKNIKLSGRHFLMDAKEQKLGEFASWNGEGHDLAFFELPNPQAPWPDQIGVSFRCMRIARE